MSNHQSAAAGITWTGRGDSAAWDYTSGDLTKTGEWFDLDISSIVGVGKRLVNVRLHYEHEQWGMDLQLRENGNSNAINVASVKTQVVSVPIEGEGWVETDDNGIVEYYAGPGIVEAAKIYIKGWFTL